MRHAAPVLSALAPALLIARAVLAVLLPMAAIQDLQNVPSELLAVSPVFYDTDNVANAALRALGV